MAMNKKERLLIEYRPKYGYAPDILAIIESMGSDTEASTHVFPVELQEALANPAGPLLKEGLKTLDEFDGFLDELEAKLADDNIGGLSFQDYLEARKNGDASTAMAYESMHRNSMDGKLDAELYPLISHVRDSLAESMKFLNEQAFYQDSDDNKEPGSAFSRGNSASKEKEAKRKYQEQQAAAVFLPSMNDSSAGGSNPNAGNSSSGSEARKTTTYAVKLGDSLGSIAVKFDMTLAEIQSLNNISDPTKIQVGQVLKVYSNTSGGSAPSITTYTVKSGDSLNSIAIKFGMTLPQIQTLNNITNPNEVQVGQVLKVYDTNGSNGSGGSGGSAGMNNGTYNSIGTGTNGSYNENSITGPSFSSDAKRQQELSSYYDNPDAMIEREARELDALVRNDLAEGTSSKELAKLKTKTEIVKAVEDGLAAKQDFLKDSKVLARQTPNSAFAAGAGEEARQGEYDENMEAYLDSIGEDTSGLSDPSSSGSMFSPVDSTAGLPEYVGIQNVVENFATASEAAISGTGAMLSIVHAKQAADMEDLGERQTKLYGKNTLKKIHDEIDRLRKLAVESEEALAWMDEVDTNFEQSSIVDVIIRNVEGINMVLDGYEDALLDLWKMNNLSQIQNDDVIDTLADKDVTRKSYNVISDMKQTYMPDAPNAAKNFVNNMGYDKASVVNTKTMTRASGSLNREDRR